MASLLWSRVKQWLRLNRSMSSLSGALRGMRRVALPLLVHLIWNERNKRLFEHVSKSVDAVFQKFQVQHGSSFPWELCIFCFVNAWRCLGHASFAWELFIAVPTGLVLGACPYLVSLWVKLVFSMFFLMVSLVVFIWLGWATPLGSGSYPNHLLFYPWFFLLFRELVPFVSFFVLYSFFWFPMGSKVVIFDLLYILTFDPKKKKLTN